MRNPNARLLAMRDPAVAALMGVDDFGVDNEYSGGSHVYGGSDDDFGFEFGLDAAIMTATGGGGRGFAGNINPGAAANMAAVHAAAAQSAAANGNGAAAQSALATAGLWSAAAASSQRTRARRSLIEPNADSDVKIERYTFALNATIAHLGTAQAILGSGAPQVNLRPQRVTANATIPGFVTLSTLQVANIGVIVGGIVDAFQFASQGVGQHLDMPTLSPANSASFTGNYTGVTPLEYGSSTAAFLFSLGLTGPASMSA